METTVVKRPASVTSAIVVLGILCLAFIAIAFIPTREGVPDFSSPFPVV
jgi:hypothetical protein